MFIIFNSKLIRCVDFNESDVCRKVLALMNNKWIINKTEEYSRKVVDNFLEASLDATLAHDEMKIDEDVENMTEDEMEEILANLV